MTTSWNNRVLLGLVGWWVLNCQAAITTWNERALVTASEPYLKCGVFTPSYETWCNDTVSAFVANPGLCRKASCQPNSLFPEMSCNSSRTCDVRWPYTDDGSPDALCVYIYTRNTSTSVQCDIQIIGFTGRVAASEPANTSSDWSTWKIVVVCVVCGICILGLFALLSLLVWCLCPAICLCVCCVKLCGKCTKCCLKCCCCCDCGDDRNGVHPEEGGKGKAAGGRGVEQDLPQPPMYPPGAMPPPWAYPPPPGLPPLYPTHQHLYPAFPQMTRQAPVPGIPPAPTAHVESFNAAPSMSTPPPATTPQQWQAGGAPPVLAPPALGPAVPLEAGAPASNPGVAAPHILPS